MMPYQPPLSMRIASDEPEDRTKILVGSSELDPKVRVEALTDEASTDLELASGRVVPGTQEEPDWAPL